MGYIVLHRKTSRFMVDKDLTKVVHMLVVSHSTSPSFCALKKASKRTKFRFPQTFGQAVMPAHRSDSQDSPREVRYSFAVHCAANCPGGGYKMICRLVCRRWRNRGRGPNTSLIATPLFCILR
jgi:hypothetical protein